MVELKITTKLCDISDIIPLPMEKDPELQKVERAHKYRAEQMRYLHAVDTPYSAQYYT